MRSNNVLVFPAGSEIAAEIWEALKWQKDICLFGASSVHDHAEAMFRHVDASIPFLGEPGLIDALNGAIARWSIDFVYPARDDVQLFLSEHADELNATLVSAPADIVRTCRSKRATYAALSNLPFIPSTFTTPTEVPSFPVFAKPDEGEGSKGAQIVRDAEEMERLMAQDRPFVFCEYLPGVEWTVDCLTDSDGVLRICLPRTRERTKAGISVRSARVTNESLCLEIREIAESIQLRLGMRGAWFFQLKGRANGSPVLMEVSPRIPGTMGLSRNLGINFPLLTLYQLMGFELKIPQPLSCEALVERALVGRYRLNITYDTVCIDYDDTLTLGEEVNPLAMAFLYQCRSRGKRILLLTHHDDVALGELAWDMQRRGIACSLFDEIIHLEPSVPKSKYVPSDNAIFIDDSFRERSEIAEQCGIPTFDVSNIESLIDWRR